LLLGVIVGIPLTLDFFGMPVMSSDQYQTWKVVHGYGVFLGFINYFFSFAIALGKKNKRHNHGLHPTRLSPLEIGGHTRFQGVLWRRLFPASAARAKPTVRPLNNPDPFRSNLGLTEKGSKDEAGGLRRLPLLLFGLDIVPVVDL